MTFVLLTLQGTELERNKPRKTLEGWLAAPMCLPAVTVGLAWLPDSTFEAHDRAGLRCVASLRACERSGAAAVDAGVGNMEYGR